MEHRTKLAVVLSEINRYAESDTVKEFSLTYITTKGVRVYRPRMCKAGKAYTYSSNSTGKKFYNVKETGVLPLFNIDLNRNETPLICLITHFNGMRIWH